MKKFVPPKVKKKRGRKRRTEFTKKTFSEIKEAIEIKIIKLEKEINEIEDENAKNRCIDIFENVKDQCSRINPKNINTINKIINTFIINFNKMKE